MTYNTKRVSAPLFDEPKRDTYRFALPHLKQFCFPVGIEGDYNPSLLKAIFFNGEALYDCTWRLYNQRVRSWLGKGIATQRQYADCFTTRQPTMLVPPQRRHVYANQFPGKGRTVWTLYNGNYVTVHGTVLSVRHAPGAEYRDVWNDRKIQPRIVAGKTYLDLDLGPQQLGCVVQTLPGLRH